MKIYYMMREDGSEEMQTTYSRQEVLYNYCLKAEELREELEEARTEDERAELLEAMQAVQMVIMALAKNWIRKHGTAPDHFDPRKYNGRR